MRPSPPPPTAPAAAMPGGSRRRHPRHRLRATLLAVAVVLIGLRIAAPYAIQWYVNRAIDATPDYEGRIGDVDLHLLRGAYAIDDIRLDKVVEGRALPFFSAERVDFSLHWSALLHGAVVGDVWIERPAITVVAATDQAARGAGAPAAEPDEEGDDQPVAKRKDEDRRASGKEGEDKDVQTGTEVDWQEKVEELFPFTINRVTVAGGTVRFVDVDERVSVAAHGLDVVATNLTNAERAPGSPLPATLDVRGRTAGDGDLRLSARLDPLAAKPAFDLGMSLTGVDLPSLNPLLRGYADFDVEDGRLDLYVDARAADGRLEGFAKPLITDLDVLDAGREIEEDGIGQVLKESAIGSTAEVLENQGEEQQGARIPLAGSLDQPQTNVWQVMASVLGNAFVSALQPGTGDEGQERRGRDGRKREKTKEPEQEKDKEKDKKARQRDGGDDGTEHDGRKARTPPPSPGRERES